VLCAIVAASASAATGTSRAEREETYQKLAILARVLNHVQTTYVDDTEPTAVVYSAIRGMVDQLDPRSTFLAPEEVASLRREARRLHFDLGFEWRRADGSVVLTSVKPGSYAQRRGAAAGQRLIAIDGAAVPTESDAAVEDALFELEGDAKVLKLVTEAGREEVVRLRFAELRRPTVRARRAPDGIVQLSVSRFTEDTGVELVRALDAQGEVRGLVLDLRGNSGGVIEAAARVADVWLSSGVIATTEARDRVVEKFVAHEHATEPAYPMAVLVDGDTASAAELVVAALHEADRAVVVGAPTFGKGTVQTVIELEDGSAIRLTVSRWFTRAHASIEGVGVRPDILRADPAEALAAALDVARGH
jgi:carboxyl-terminal processing protease